MGFVFARRLKRLYVHYTRLFPAMQGFRAKRFFFRTCFAIRRRLHAFLRTRDSRASGRDERRRDGEPPSGRGVASEANAEDDEGSHRATASLEPFPPRRSRRSKYTPPCGRDVSGRICCLRLIHRPCPILGQAVPLPPRGKAPRRRCRRAKPKQSTKPKHCRLAAEAVRTRLVAFCPIAACVASREDSSLRSE